MCRLPLHAVNSKTGINAAGTTLYNRRYSNNICYLSLDELLHSPLHKFFYRSSGLLPYCWRTLPCRHDEPKRICPIPLGGKELWVLAPEEELLRLEKLNSEAVPARWSRNRLQYYHRGWLPHLLVGLN
jgi:hypothetical protein